MKKRLLAALLTLISVFLLAGCSMMRIKQAEKLMEEEKYGEAYEILVTLDTPEAAELAAKAQTEWTKQAIPGKWRSEAIDLSAAIGEEIAKGGEFEEYADLLTPQSFDLYMILELNSDGTLEVTADKDGLRSEWSKYANQAGDVLDEIIAAEFEKELGMDITYILSLLGLSSEEELVEMVLGMSAKEFFEDYGDDVMSEFDFSESGTWTVNGTKITLTEGDGGDIATYDPSRDTITIEGEEEVYPMVFRRVK